MNLLGPFALGLEQWQRLQLLRVASLTRGLTV